MSKKRKAFTLIEIMAAASIMTVVFVVVLGLASKVLTTWNRTSGEVRANFQANVLMRMLQDDLESAIMKKDGGAWFEVVYTDTVGQLTGTNPDATVPMIPPDIMFFASPVARPRYTKDQYSANAYERKPIPGSVCAMRYKLALKSPFLQSSANQSDNIRQYNAFYGMYRAVIDSQATFDDVLGPDVQGSDENSAEDALANFWFTQNCNLLDEDGQRKSAVLKTWTLSPENFLAQNVVDFRVGFTVMYYDEDKRAAGQEPKSYAEIAPGTKFTVAEKILVDSPLRRKNARGSYTYDVMPEQVENGSIVYADVSITVLTDQGAKEMKARMERNMLSSDQFREIVVQNSVTVVRRITFMSERL